MAMTTLKNTIGGSGSVGDNISDPAKPRLPSKCPSPAETSSKEARKANTIKLTMGGIFFLILSIGVFKYQFNKIQVDSPLCLWTRFEWRYLFLMFLVVPLDTLAGSIRLWVISRVVIPSMTCWTCVKSELANIGTGLLTPSQTGGGLGQIYILCRGGASVGSATAISFISFTGTMLVLLGIGLYSLFFTHIGNMEGIFRYAVMIFLSVILSMLLVAFFPGLLRRIVRKTSMAFGSLMPRSSQLQNLRSRESKDKNGAHYHGKLALSEGLIELIENYHKCLRCYLQAGKINFLWVFILSFAFLFFRSLVAFLCLRFLGIHQPSLSHIVEIQLVLIFLIYFAPTPGGAGISELMSLTIMSSLMPVEIAPYYNLLWRTTTLYLPAVAGLIYLFHAIAAQGRKTLMKKGARYSENKEGFKI
jgi:uncharacterized protein (TIRG00374 family)